MAEHVQMRHPGNRGVRWASVAVFLAVVAVISAAVWPLVHDRLPFGSVAAGAPPAPVPHPAVLHAHVGSTRPLAGASSLTMYGGALWVTQRSSHGAATVVRYSAHALKPEGPAIAIRHAGGAPVRVAAGRAGVFVRTSSGIERLTGHSLTAVRASAVPRPLLLSLYGTAGFGRAWVVAGHRLYVRSAGAPAAKRLATPFALAAVQPAVAGGKLWLARAANGGASSTAQIQPLTPAAHIAGPPVRVGNGSVTLELAGAGRLWVVVTRPGPRSWLDQVNPATGKVIGVTALPKRFVPTEGLANGRSVWLAQSGKHGAVVRLSLTRRASA